MWRILEIIIEIYYGLGRVVLYGMEMCFFWKCQLNTPILASFKTNQNNAFIINLIQKGYNVKTANKLGETPLHIAVSRPSMVQVVHELIKSGADINAQDKSKRTPLRHAVQHDSMEAVCILLFYNADVNIVCKQGMTPFTYALYSFRLNIARILMDYYDDFSNQKCYRVTSLHLAVAHDSGVAISLLNKGADVNSVTSGGQSLLEFSLHYDNATLFKYILSKMDHKVLLQSSSSFLLRYVNECHFTTSDWLEGMYLLLESPVAAELIQACNDWMSYDEISEFTFFQRLAQVFHLKEVESKDRISIIYICLNLGAQVNIYDTIVTYLSYGFNEEVEALIEFTFVTNCYGEPLTLPDGYNISMPAFILAVEQDLNINTIYKIIIDQIKSNSDASTIVFSQESFGSFFGFFSMSSEMKNQFMSLSQTQLLPDNLLEKFNIMRSRIAEVPTLLELSRRQAREFIKQTCNVNKPYEFHNAVRNLKVPQIIKDVIRLKTPIY